MIEQERIVITPSEYESLEALRELGKNGFLLIPTKRLGISSRSATTKGDKRSNLSQELHEHGFSLQLPK